MMNTQDIRHDSTDPDDGIAPLDWQDQPFSCEGCAHTDLKAKGKCEYARACVHDRYARRVDRFFRWNPELGNQYLTHPYFEVRAIGARHADVFKLPALIEDEDETVRMSIAMRLPQRLLLKMVRDPHREVRIRVAQRLEADQLKTMTADPDYYVRAMVARRLPLSLLSQMAQDEDNKVREEVARRMEMPALLNLIHDPDSSIRRIVAQRLPVDLLDRLTDDEDWLVRWEITQRANPGLLATMSLDVDPEVRLAVADRMTQLSNRQHIDSEVHHG